MRALALLLGLSLLITACGRKDAGGTGSLSASPDVVAGVYTSTEFQEPGQNDAGVDLNAKGGYLNLTLTRDYKVEGKLVVPPEAGSNYDGTDQAFQGTWRAAGSGLVIEGTGTLIDGRDWICGIGTLETSGGGRGPFRIALKKMHDLPTQ
jgi:hypothetical protein